MKIEVIKTELEVIKAFRIVFLHENNFQFVYDKCHYYGWADDYLFLIDGNKIGYGAVWGKDKREDRDAIMEFFVLKPFRQFSNLIFRDFVSVSGAAFIECQSNDFLLSEMMYEYAENINAEAVLFEDHHQTHFAIPGILFRRDRTDNKNPSDVDGYILEKNGEVIATGGFMLNYNIPYADIYMEVKESFRRNGFGSLLIQELKKEIYLMGRVPAARCNINNQASKASLLKAGFGICGHRLNGLIKTSTVLTVG
ncbi:MAG: GNAT family N-acetyltransferase [Chitinophagaceae bacterium]|nr:GNAT family N-acetyltransferase [Chitinophagaceae bacterium]